MEQRPLRLGDNVDDYCPRERRVTNHAIVAIVGDSVRQTRCSACDTEHEFKGARMPRKLVKPAGEAGGILVTPRAVSSPSESAPAVETAVTAAAATATTATEVAPAAEQAGGEPDQMPPDGWAAHRRLIRASREDVFDGPALRPGCIAAWLIGFFVYEWLYQPTDLGFWSHWLGELWTPQYQIGASVPSFVVAFLLTAAAVWLGSARAAARARREPLPGRR